MTASSLKPDVGVECNAPCSSAADDTGRCASMNDKKIRKIVHNNHDPYKLVEAVLTEVGLVRQYEMRETSNRDGISISTRTTTPHERWVSPWRDMTQ